MTMNTILSSLKEKLSNDAQILQDSQDTAFKESLQRWSNLGLQVPGAIIKPATELDAVTIVRVAFPFKMADSFNKDARSRLRMNRMCLSCLYLAVTVHGPP